MDKVRVLLDLTIIRSSLISDQKTKCKGLPGAVRPH